MKGTCKWWSSDRGYGFIVGEDGTDYFVHYKEIVGDGRRDLQEAEKVEFEIKAPQPPRGPVAIHVVRA